MIRIPLYNLIIYIKVYSSFDALKKGYFQHIKRYRIVEEDNLNSHFAAAIIVPPNQIDKTYLLLQKDFLDYNTITHEVYHLTNRILYHQGVTFNIIDDEPFAILNGYLNQEVINYLQKKKFINGNQ